MNISINTNVDSHENMLLGTQQTNIFKQKAPKHSPHYYFLFHRRLPARMLGSASWTSEAWWRLRLSSASWPTSITATVTKMISSSPAAFFFLMFRTFVVTDPHFTEIKNLPHWFYVNFSKLDSEEFENNIYRFYYSVKTFTKETNSNPKTK